MKCKWELTRRSVQVAGNDWVSSADSERRGRREEEALCHLVNY